jgi:hypothetical protein
VLTHLKMITPTAVGAGLGGAIGYERDRHCSFVGLRTHLIVALTAATFMIISSQCLPAALRRRWADRGGRLAHRGLGGLRPRGPRAPGSRCGRVRTDGGPRPARHLCQVLGCRNNLDVDVHHIQPRAEGGSHAPENLLTLCGAHHRAVHAGHLELSGKAPHGLDFRHADGTEYGQRAVAEDVDVSEKVFRGLRGLDFKETEVKLALARARAEPHIDGERVLTAEVLLKRALVHLAPPVRGEFY